MWRGLSRFIDLATGAKLSQKLCPKMWVIVSPGMPPPGWDTTFGPGGTLPRFLSSLLIVVEMRIHYSSGATFSEVDKAEIIANRMGTLALLSR